MTDDEFRSRIAEVERYVAKVGFLCPKGCRDWWHHAEATVGYLSECIEAEFYGVERPPLDSGIAHLDADIARHLEWFDQKWGAR